ncbi:MAG: GPW/gp25 family protein [Paracoccus sp. (in: a-proteobacteria)]|nr:GPW/gp25 family protein [Paracoccus sp. (in: a-proteobacteria)]
MADRNGNRDDSQITQSGLRQMSLMHVFRDSARRHDARDPDHRMTEGERDLTLRSQKRREGVSEAAQRQDLALDLASLMNTIRLDVAMPLDDTPRVRDSVVNHGFQDMDSLWRNSRNPADMAQAIRLALLRNEPRLRAASVDVQVRDIPTGPEQRVTFEIMAEMIANPTDIPLLFLAEVDPTAGKIAMTRMQGDS